MYIMIVATLNLVLGYWLGICVHEDARDADAQTDQPRRANEIIAQASALTQVEVRKAAPAPVQPALDTSVASPAPTIARSETVGTSAGSPAIGVSELANGLNTYREQLADIDARLRSSARDPKREHAEQCLAEFKTSSVAYLASQENASALLNQLDIVDPLRSSIHGELQHAIEAQRQDIEAANQHASDIDFELDLAAGFQQLLAETAKVIESNYVLGDKIADAHERLSATGEAADNEPVDRNLLISRDQFEATLETWWREHKDAGRRLTLALIEIDGFAEINNEYGITLGDGVLHAVSRMIARSLRIEDRATRYSGGKFLIMLPDTSVQDSTNTVELLRQTIAATEFRRSDRPVEVKVSCAVAEAELQDTLFTLLDRVELTLQESKRYGSNCTYIYEENHPSPITPPQLDVNPRTLVL